MHTRRFPSPGRLVLPGVLVVLLSGSQGNRPAAAGFATVPQATAVQAPSAAPVRVDADTQMQDLRALASPELQGRLTGTAGSRRAQALILERFKQLKLQPLNGSFQQKFSFTQARRGGKEEFPEATNLIAVLPGTAEPQSFVVVSAHYDHLGVREGQTYPGADDNASGVAAMLAIARWFAAHPPSKSLLFVAFDAEEEGLQGSKHFVAKPPVDLKRITVVVNMDMVGRGDAGTLFVAGTHHYPSLAPVVTEAARGRQLTMKFGHDKPAAQGGPTTGRTRPIMGRFMRPASRSCISGSKTIPTTTSRETRRTNSRKVLSRGDRTGARDRQAARREQGQVTVGRVVMCSLTACR